MEGVGMFYWAFRVTHCTCHITIVDVGNVFRTAITSSRSQKHEKISDFAPICVGDLGLDMLPGYHPVVLDLFETSYLHIHAERKG